MEIRMATEGDYHNMVTLRLSPNKPSYLIHDDERIWAESKRHEPTRGAWITNQMEDWKRYMQGENSGIFVAYEGDALQGFAAYYHGYGRRFTTGVVDLFVAHTVPLAKVARELLIAVKRQAVIDGQNSLRISIDYKDQEMKELLLSLGAEQEGILGCCYTYYEEYVWKHLKEEREMAFSPAMRQARLENEWLNIVEPMNRPGFVEITHSTDYSKFYVTVHAPSYVVSKGGAEPTLKYTHKFTVYVGSNYPADKPRVVFDNKDERIAHINVWDTGTFCIGEWAPKMCNIGTTISKCIHAIGFDPTNWRKDSMACSANLAFLEKKEREGAFPTFDMKKVPIPGQKAPVKQSRFRRI